MKYLFHKLAQKSEPKSTPRLSGTIHVTNSDGQFQLTGQVYEGQVLTVEAAGFVPQAVALTDCELPRLVLTPSPDARFRRSGKRAGQVTRLRNARL